MRVTDFEFHLVTVGREFHPAPKNYSTLWLYHKLTDLFCLVIFLHPHHHTASSDVFVVAVLIHVILLQTSSYVYRDWLI